MNTFPQHSKIKSNNLENNGGVKMATTATVGQSAKQNRFESLDDFKAFVRDKFINGSGIDPKLFDACVEFHQDIETAYPGSDWEAPIHEQLGWTWKRFRKQANENIYAAFLMNEDGSLWQAIVSIWDEDKQRPYRYLAPKGKGDRAFIPKIPQSIWNKIAKRYGKPIAENISFWEWLKEVEIPRIITEGGKKALSAISQGYACIALYGCRCGVKKSGDLIPELEALATNQSKWLIGFDKDKKPSAQKSVRLGIKRIKNTLSMLNSHTISMNWDEDYKGIDDLITGKGSAAFDAAYGEAIARLEASISPKEAGISQSKLAEELSERYRNRLAWHVGNKCWYEYERKLDGVWCEISDELVARMVIAEAKNRIGATFKYDFVAGTTKFLKADLAVEEWEEQQGLIPMRDGVLNPKTLELMEHSPGYRFLWQLPYRWADRAIGHEPISNWLNETMKGDKTLVQLLRAYLKAIVCGRYDLQRFLECIGPGGTGKSTYQRLAVALIGEENATVTTLKQLEGNRFESASLYGKRLVLITDSERYGGETATLKAITGGDEVRNERKGIQQTRGFKFPGMVLVGANEPIQSSDYTSGLRRRRLTVPFNNQVAPHLRRNLEKEFQPYLAGVLQWVLELPDEEMTALIVDTANSVSSLNTFSAEFLLDTNPLADWLENCCIRDEKAKTYIGTLDKPTEHYLYANYVKWMEGTGSKPVSLRRFSDCVVDLCKSQLGMGNVSKFRDPQGVYISGIDIRHAGHSNEPRFITGVGEEKTQAIASPVIEETQPEIEAKQIEILPTLEEQKQAQLCQEVAPQLEQGDKVVYQGIEGEVMTINGNQVFIDFGDRACSVSINEVVKVE
ncbi:phage/plasmid primase, P4 family [Nostoc parmelioides]|uniref:DUF3854 domain-containing protein n=1 Tax=Nostoc parmelioides FACHB-3921 TaxID=2692909 RepID=A0ABR8BN90_9NOSO|nr:phage/plasmid primase, P4 family [Nostoc parmelioides]MBD2255598.1 DUF3854 domain-containing protein [Nostoc parmelioides FACHB-3921]